MTWRLSASRLACALATGSLANTGNAASVAALSDAAFAFGDGMGVALSPGPQAESDSNNAEIRTERHSMSGFLWRTHAMMNADASVLMLRESFVKRLREMRVTGAFFCLLSTGFS
ncbi:hypothetical protein [Caballeronia sp. NK8]|uniref:hypothetical protein n=1 Tax=Caballeronia sp. NK8 TaxID=140098 RepID=UPI001BD1440B|nr:hypothetical protein [Caballeronia sp. NK8]